MGARDGGAKLTHAVHESAPMKLAPAILAAAAMAVPAALAGTTDLVVHCDPPLARPLRNVAVAFLARTGVKLRLFPTAPNAIAAQLVRAIQNDVVVTQSGVLDRLAADGMPAAMPRVGPWHNRMVIAARNNASRRPPGLTSCAACDPGWGGGPDGPALLAAAGLRPGTTIGTFDTAEAQALLRASGLEVSA